MLNDMLAVISLFYFEESEADAYMKKSFEYSLKTMMYSGENQRQNKIVEQPELAKMCSV